MSALGLGGYCSSEDDDEIAVSTSGATDTQNGPTESESMPSTNAQQTATPSQETASTTKTVSDPIPAQTLPRGAGAGPAPGPALMTTESITNALPEPEDDAPPGSPYTSTRLQMRNLTMPPVPNFDIPASPPGSPPAGSTKKFTHFLALKKQGVHFNERLLQSSALRNPQLLQKLMIFAGISHEEQYKSSLPEGLAPRTEFSEEAYVNQLIKAHQKIAAQRESEQRGKRDRLDFVSGKTEGGDNDIQPAKKKSRFDAR